MKFINPNFMLHNDTAKKLYNDYAKDMLIYDYHCHLSPEEIAKDKPFDNITQIWLYGDHYKWRAMRANGVYEKFVTGNSSDFEKFEHWAKTLDNCIANPLYHWSALELKRYFDIDEILSFDNYKDIWERANKVIIDKKYSPKKMITMSNVAVVCTTDSPVDDLKWHKIIKEDKEFKTRVVPGFRPDEVLSIGTKKFYDFIPKLEKIVDFKIDTYEKMLDAIKLRIKYFDENDGYICDHGILKLPYIKSSRDEVYSIFEKALNKQVLTNEEIEKYLTTLLIDLAKEYKKYDWTMQIHFGAIRNNNEKYFETLGPDTGFDSIADTSDVAYCLNNLLNDMSKNDGLPKMIIYNLDPTLNNVIACNIANFQINSGKLQFGAGWWFNDTKEGMIRQMKTLADQGLLAKFVGMLTDSRSFVSYTRHEYFRRILCQYIGELVELGEIPNDEKILKKLIQNICYNNANTYFKKER
ncbi:glucuronate isomerase [Caviibacter abscessus]|uniref:glucuronate isomerase n=1 Tax=Caviibacter abscessus TaxID=1766719 RepID=UPI000830A3E9|nr:glucuronate isomerase [Caviibacter abscessus]